MDKFGRNYELLVETTDGSGDILKVAPPFTLEFDIQRHTLTSANVCQLRVYNLSEKTRNRVRHNANDFGNYKGIQLRAGYGRNMPVIFSGNAQSAMSVRQGVDFITEFMCFDGGFAMNTGVTNTVFQAGTPTAAMIGTLMATLPNVKPGAVGSYPGITTRATALSGNTVDILRELTGGGFFIDNETAYALNTDEYVLDPNLLTINSDTGLLGTPALEATSITHFDMIFEPSLAVGRVVNLASKTGKNYNGQYKVTAVYHKGVISESVAGSVITTAEFFYSKELTGVAGA